MKKNLLFVIFMICSILTFIYGCGGKKDDKTVVLVQVPTVDLRGNIEIPTVVNTQLLASIKSAQNTDSEVRNAFANALVWVNDTQVTNRVITPSAVESLWDFRIMGVPQAPNGIYRIQVLAGKLGLKAYVPSAKKDTFTINSRTTAAALLADSTKVDAEAILATFPAIVSKVAGKIEQAFNAPVASFTGGSIFTHQDVVSEVASQSSILKNLSGFDSFAKIAYLGLSNDLDGNGKDDLFISQTIDRTGIRFYTSVSDQTSMLPIASTLASYSREALLDDFAKNNTRADRTFDSSARDFILGLFFAKSAVNDIYLKLLVRRIDLLEGNFKGVVAEYEFVTATGTAISTGTKKLAMLGATPASGTVVATDFLIDTVATGGYLAYLDQDRGLGSPDGVTRIIRCIDGQPELAKLSSAEPYNDYGAGYYVNSTAALKAVNKNRKLVEGDVFSIFFPKTRHYALIKILHVESQFLTLEYVVNSARDEPKF